MIHDTNNTQTLSRVRKTKKTNQKAKEERKRSEIKPLVLTTASFVFRVNIWLNSSTLSSSFQGLFHLACTLSHLSFIPSFFLLLFLSQSKGLVIYGERYVRRFIGGERILSLGRQQCLPRLHPLYRSLLHHISFL